MSQTLVEQLARPSTPRPPEPAVPTTDAPAHISPTAAKAYLACSLKFYFEHELQLVSYQLMLEAATGESPPGLELVFLVKTKVPQVIKVRVPPADRHRKARVVRLLETAVAGIAAGRFHPQPGMHCSWCPYRAECSAWIPLRDIAA